LNLILKKEAVWKDQWLLFCFNFRMLYNWLPTKRSIWNEWIQRDKKV